MADNSNPEIPNLPTLKTFSVLNGDYIYLYPGRNKTSASGRNRFVKGPKSAGRLYPIEGTNDKYRIVWQDWFIEEHPALRAYNAYYSNETETKNSIVPQSSIIFTPKSGTSDSNSMLRQQYYEAGATWTLDQLLTDTPLTLALNVKFLKAQWSPKIFSLAYYIALTERTSFAEYPMFASRTRLPTQEPFSEEEISESLVALNASNLDDFWQDLYQRTEEDCGNKTDFWVIDTAYPHDVLEQLRLGKTLPYLEQIPDLNNLVNRHRRHQLLVKFNEQHNYKRVVEEEPDRILTVLNMRNGQVYTASPYKTKNLSSADIAIFMQDHNLWRNYQNVQESTERSLEDDPEYFKTQENHQLLTDSQFAPHLQLVQSPLMSDNKVKSTRTLYPSNVPLKRSTSVINNNLDEKGLNERFITRPVSGIVPPYPITLGSSAPLPTRRQSRKKQTQASLYFNAEQSGLLKGLAQNVNASDSESSTTISALSGSKRKTGTQEPAAYTPGALGGREVNQTSMPNASDYAEGFNATLGRQRKGRKDYDDEFDEFEDLSSNQFAKKGFQDGKLGSKGRTSSDSDYQDKKEDDDQVEIKFDELFARQAQKDAENAEKTEQASKQANQLEARPGTKQDADLGDFSGAAVDSSSSDFSDDGAVGEAGDELGSVADNGDDSDLMTAESAAINTQKAMEQLVDENGNRRSLDDVLSQYPNVSTYDLLYHQVMSAEENSGKTKSLSSLEERNELCGESTNEQVVTVEELQAKYQQALREKELKARQLREAEERRKVEEEEARQNVQCPEVILEMGKGKRQSNYGVFITDRIESIQEQYSFYQNQHLPFLLQVLPETELYDLCVKKCFDELIAADKYDAFLNRNTLTINLYENPAEYEEIINFFNNADKEESLMDTSAAKLKKTKVSALGSIFADDADSASDLRSHSISSQRISQNAKSQSSPTSLGLSNPTSLGLEEMYGNSSSAKASQQAQDRLGHEAKGSSSGLGKGSSSLGAKDSKGGNEVAEGAETTDGKSTRSGPTQIKSLFKTAHRKSAPMILHMCLDLRAFFQLVEGMDASANFEKSDMIVDPVEYEQALKARTNEVKTKQDIVERAAGRIGVKPHYELTDEQQELGESIMDLIQKRNYVLVPKIESKRQKLRASRILDDEEARLVAAPPNMKSWTFQRETRLLSLLQRLAKTKLPRTVLQVSITNSMSRFEDAALACNMLTTQHLLYERLGPDVFWQERAPSNQVTKLLQPNKRERVYKGKQFIWFLALNLRFMMTLKMEKSNRNNRYGLALKNDIVTAEEMLNQLQRTTCTRKEEGLEYPANVNSIKQRQLFTFLGLGTPNHEEFTTYKQTSIVPLMRDKSMFPK